MPEALNFETVTEALNKKSTDQLLDIIQYTQDDYKPEVLPTIIEILKTRGVNENQINEANTKYHTVIKNAHQSNFKTKEKGLNKVVLWIIYIIGFVMLSYIIGEVKGGLVHLAIESSK